MKEYHPNETYKYAAIKRDGHFTRVEIGETVEVYSRSGIRITEKVCWCDWYQKITAACSTPLPFPLAFYGEMWVPGQSASYVRTAQCTRDPLLRFDVFGAEFHDEMETTTLETVQSVAECYQLPMIPFWKFDPKDPTNGIRVGGDVEGFVYSNGNMTDQAKHKPMRSADLLISGFTPGNGKYAHSIGAVLVSTADGEEMAAISGMTDALRADMTAHPKAYLKKVVEVKYQQIGSKGRLRHPIFVGLRDDKPATECTIEQFR